MTRMVNKPKVLCLMMSTIDGKIGRRSPGADVVDEYIDVYRAIDNGIAGSHETKGNAWMCGRVTSQLYFSDTSRDELSPLNRILPLGDYIAPARTGRYFITIDTQGSLRWKTNSILFYPEHGELSLVIVVSEATPEAYLGYLRDKGISYIIGGKKRIKFETVLATLSQQFQIHQLLLEGGGKLNGSFVEAGLIDELYLLIVPRVLNKANEPSVFDSTEDSNSELYQFDLQETKIMDRGSVLLHYRKK